jgi:uncharacterized protein (DUF1697 family)
MTHYIAFLRAINAGPGRTLSMENLRRYFQPLGFNGVETILSTGNVTFSASGSARTLEDKIETRLHRAMKNDVTTFLRTEAELARIAVYQPFPAAFVEPEAEVNIIFLKSELDPETAQKVAALNSETDEFVVNEREIYWLRRKKEGSSPYSTIALDRVLKQPFTVRSSRTVRKLAARYSAAYQSLVNMS